MRLVKYGDLSDKDLQQICVISNCVDCSLKYNGVCVKGVLLNLKDCLSKEFLEKELTVPYSNLITQDEAKYLQKFVDNKKYRKTLFCREYDEKTKSYSLIVTCCISFGSGYSNDDIYILNLKDENDFKNLKLDEKYSAEALSL